MCHLYVFSKLRQQREVTQKSIQSETQAVLHIRTLEDFISKQTDELNILNQQTKDLELQLYQLQSEPMYRPRDRRQMRACMLAKQNEVGFEKEKRFTIFYYYNFSYYLIIIILIILIFLIIFVIMFTDTEHDIYKRSHDLQKGFDRTEIICYWW